MACSLLPACWGTALLVLVSLAAVAGLGYWLWGMTSLSLGIGVGLVIGGRHREQSDRPGGLRPGGGLFPLSRLRL